jgi:hypothetical protein
MPVPGGYQALAEILGQGVDVRYNHTVTAINYGPQGVSVECSNGSVFEANCVIVTTSLGVLQAQHKQLFNPPLPRVRCTPASRLSQSGYLIIYAGRLRCSLALQSVSPPSRATLFIHHHTLQRRIR